MGTTVRKPTLRIGLIGPAADNDESELQQAAEFLIVDAEADQVIYLGSGAVIHRVVDAWPHQSAEERARIRRLPDPPARAIEMLDSWIMLAIHDKAWLDQEDIANSHLIVYGVAHDALLRSFGSRSFFTPGPVAKGKVGLVELHDTGELQVSLFEFAGTPLWSETLSRRGSQLLVSH